MLKAAKQTGRVYTVEEHSIIGGLGSAVAELLGEKCPTKITRIGVKDVFGESGPAKELLHKYELDAEGMQNVLWRNRNHVRGIKKTGLMRQIWNCRGAG